MFELVVLPKSLPAKVIQELQPPARKQFWERVKPLRESPFAVSERAGFYAPDGGQLYRFNFYVSGVGFYFLIVLKFADTKDENTLLVADIRLRMVE